MSVSKVLGPGQSEDRQTLSLDDQKREIDELIDRESLKVVESFAGKGKGESQSAHKRGRPIFNHVMQQIENGKANGLLVYHPNRIARNAFDGGLVITLMDEGNLLEIRTPTKTYLNNPDDKFWLALEFNMAKKSSDDNGVAVSRGIKTKLLAGWYPSRAPLGYLNTKNYEEKGRNFILKDGERFDAVRRMWDLMITGNYTPPQIVKIANDEWKFKTRPTKRHAGLKPLSRSNIYKVFTNQFYYGYFEYGKGENRKLYQGKHEPMITEKEYDIVQKLLGRHGRPRAQKHRFAFTGLMRCGNCDAMITVEQKIKRQKNGNVHDYIYYRCTKQKDEKCQEKAIELKELSTQIDAEINKLTISEKFKDWAIRDLHEIRQTQAQTHEAMLNNSERDHLRITQQLDNLLLKYSSPENTEGQLISDQEYQDVRTRLLKQKAALESSISTQNREIEEWLELSERTFNFARYARTWFARGDMATKRAIFACLGSHLVIQDQKLAITLRPVFKTIFETLPKAEGEISKIRTYPQTVFSGSNKEKAALVGQSISTWRCLFENIRTELAGGGGGGGAPPPPPPPPPPPRLACPTDRREPERKGRFQVFLWRRILSIPF